MTRIYTDLATFDVGPDGAIVRDLHGASLDDLRGVVGLDLELTT